MTTTPDGIHSCGWHCNNPACIKSQRDEMRGRLEAQAQPERKPLSDAEIEAMAHRMASTYAHRTDPTSHAYGFVRHTLINFVRAVEAAHKIG